MFLYFIVDPLYPANVIYSNMVGSSNKNFIGKAHFQFFFKFSILWITFPIFFFHKKPCMDYYEHV